MSPFPLARRIEVRLPDDVELTDNQRSSGFYRHDSTGWWFSEWEIERLMPAYGEPCEPCPRPPYEYVRSSAPTCTGALGDVLVMYCDPPDKPWPALLCRSCAEAFVAWGHASEPYAGAMWDDERRAWCAVSHQGHRIAPTDVLQPPDYLHGDPIVVR